MNMDLLLRLAAERGALDAEKQKLKKDFDGTFEDRYQSWYTESLAVIRQLVPDRATEFEHLYRGDGKRREINISTYNIQDWMNGVRAATSGSGIKIFDDFAAVSMRFRTQRQILEAIQQRFESTLFDIRQLVQADLFESELDAARELAKHNFRRGAGAVAGVVLEKNLDQVRENHRIKIGKKHLTIGDLNEALRSAGVLDVPAWRGIQRLGDIRNLCDHHKDREPTADEISELIDGVDKITKTLF